MSSLSRRALLRRLAAGAGAAYLYPLMSRLSHAGPSTSATPRFVFIVEGNCYEPITVLDPAVRDQLNMSTGSYIQPTDRWWYGGYKHTSPFVASSTAFDQTIALKAIAANGLSAQTAVVFGLSSRVTGGGHSAMHGVLSSTRTAGGIPAGPTIDAALAAVPQVRGTTPYDAIRLGVSGVLTAPLNYGMCAFDIGVSAPLIVDPYSAYSLLFGLVGSASGTAEFNRRGKQLAFAQQDVNAALAAFSGNSAERSKLEAYLSAIQDLTQRQSKLSAMQATLATVAPTAPDSNPLYMHNTTADNDPISRFSAQLELAAAALIGGLTNVVVVGSGAGGMFDMVYPTANPAANATINRHSLHHGSGLNLTYQQTIHDITAQQLTAIASMASKLKGAADPATGGTMLDSTIIVYIGDNGEQHHSTASEFPVVLIGGGAVGLRTGGRTIVYPGVTTGGAGHRQVSNLWNTLGHLTGANPFTLGKTKIDFDQFGKEGSGRVAKGPLSELLT